MTKILHVICSPRGQASESYRLSRKIIEFLVEHQPSASLVDRVIGTDMPHVDENYAIAQQSAADPSQEGAISRSDELIQELESSDFVVIATPVHNYTVPSALKVWIDHIVRVRRTFDLSPTGKVGMLRDRPVFIAVASGGRYSGESARQPDFLTPYLKAILGMIGLRDLTFFSVQGTAFGQDAVAEARAEANRALQEHFAGHVPSRVRPAIGIALPVT